VVGPAGFIVAWVVSGAATEGYSPVSQAISRLAAAGAPTRWLMTAGFVSFGLAVPAYAAALRASLPGYAWASAAVSGLATLGVAIFPLDVSGGIDALHGGFAVLGYAALALVPILAARPLAAARLRRAAAASIVLGVLSGACLAATLLGPAHGLFQRLGLTLGDAWLITTAVGMLRGVDRRSTPTLRWLPR
jgi:hypothetical membrane protein